MGYEKDVTCHLDGQSFISPDDGLVMPDPTPRQSFISVHFHHYDWCKPCFCSCPQRQNAAFCIMFQWRGEMTEMWREVCHTVRISALLKEIGSRTNPGIIWGAKANLSVKMLGPIFQLPEPSFLVICPKHFQLESWSHFFQERHGFTSWSFSVWKYSRHIWYSAHSCFQNYVSCQGI